MSKLLWNAAECLTCHQIVESRYRHDFQQCSCWNVFVDGGKDYARHGFMDESRYVNLSKYEEESHE